MDSQTPTEMPNLEFLPGTAVIYAMHGKCQVIGTETRTLGGQSIRFYKLEMKKSHLSRSTKGDSAIWVPVDTAKDRGLREPMTKAEAEAAIKILMSREYFFKPTEPWAILIPCLESAIRHEGGVGLAKVTSFLFVLKRKQIIAPPEVIKIQEAVSKLLLKELSEALETPIRILEDKIAKGLKTKLLPDN